MKRIVAWLVFSLLTFAVGTIAVAMWLDHWFLYAETRDSVLSVSQTPGVTSELPILEYCELAENPQKYDGERVRVRTRLYFFIHGFKFLDTKCSAAEQEAAVKFAAGREDEIFAKLAEATGSSEYIPWAFPEIVAVGKFSRTIPSRKSDSMSDNAYLIFEISEIEQITVPPSSPAPADPPFQSYYRGDSQLEGLYYLSWPSEDDRRMLVISFTNTSIPPKSNDPDAPTQPGFYLSQSSRLSFAEVEVKGRSVYFKTRAVNDVIYEFRGRAEYKIDPNFSDTVPIPYIKGVLKEIKRGRAVKSEKIEFGHAVIA